MFRGWSNVPRSWASISTSQTDYGDEFQGLTPWELFDEQEAHEALAVAEEAVSLAQTTVRGVLP
jgi:hypothetical protein